MKYYLIYERLDFLISHKSTGTPEQLARKLNTSKRHLFNYLSDMKELGKNISYSKSSQSYVYLGQ
ncbi:MAG: HTH domain-containing protein [Bacteroidales bacterium]|nr:HTH domain-containing protein [Bacteroidales bacterium]